MITINAGHAALLVMCSSGKGKLLARVTHLLVSLYGGSAVAGRWQVLYGRKRTTRRDLDLKTGRPGMSKGAEVVRKLKSGLPSPVKAGEVVNRELTAAALYCDKGIDGSCKPAQGRG